MTTILVLSGPLPFLKATSDFESRFSAQAAARRLDVRFCRANGEAALLDFLEANEDASGYIINPGSIAPIAYGLADAVARSKKPCIEVLLEAPAASGGPLTKVAVAKVHGESWNGYFKALDLLAEHVSKEPPKTLGPSSVARPTKTIGRRAAVDAFAEAPPKLSKAAIVARLTATLAGTSPREEIGPWAREQWARLQNDDTLGAKERSKLDQVLLALSSKEVLNDHGILRALSTLDE